MSFNIVNNQVMKNLILTFTSILALWGGSAIGQEYDEEAIQKQIEKFRDNPKLYYDKVKADKERADQANQNTLKVSEEYMALMDKKDSLLKMYKMQLAKARTAAPASASTTASTTPPAKTIVPNDKQVVLTKPSATSTPYRVQLAAFYRDDFSKFFGTFNKTIGVQKLDDRNVIEVQGFKDEAEALEFSQKIKKLGFNGAFVAKYNEGGAREEGYKPSKNGTSLSDDIPPPPAKSSTPITASSKNVSYPSQVPAGYQEIKSPKATPKPSPVPQQAIAKSTSPKGVDYPTQAPAALQEPKTTPKPALQNPQINRKAILSSAATPAPKTLASASPPPSIPAPKAVAASKDKSDQLDAAFDQLFKR